MINRLTSIPTVRIMDRNSPRGNERLHLLGQHQRVEPDEDGFYEVSLSDRPPCCRPLLLLSADESTHSKPRTDSFIAGHQVKIANVPVGKTGESVFRRIVNKIVELFYAIRRIFSRSTTASGPRPSVEHAGRFLKLLSIMEQYRKGETTRENLDKKLSTDLPIILDTRSYETELREATRHVTCILRDEEFLDFFCRRGGSVSLLLDWDIHFRLSMCGWGSESDLGTVARKAYAMCLHFRERRPSGCPFLIKKCPPVIQQTYDELVSCTDRIAALAVELELARCTRRALEKHLGRKVIQDAKTGVDPRTLLVPKLLDSPHLLGKIELDIERNIFRLGRDRSFYSA